MFNPLSAEFTRDPHAMYRALRADPKPVYSPKFKLWFLSRYDHVSTIALHPSSVRSLEGLIPQAELRQRQRDANWHNMPYHERVVQFSLLDSDGQTHRRLRGLVFAELTHKKMSTLLPALDAFVDHLLGGLAEIGEFDFVGDFAQHIPGFVIGELLGIPLADRPQLRRWSEDIVQYFDLDRSDAKKQVAESASESFYHYICDLLKESHHSNLLSVMHQDFIDGKYSLDELISTVMLILMAGHGSSIDMLGNTMHLLLQNPDALARLHNQQGFDDTAMQECFRLEPPLPFFHRHIIDDVELAGQTFPAGTTFGLLYASANRDDAVFENPDQLILDRHPNRHLAFGRGAHLCLGNHLARLSIARVFAKLFSRFRHFELLEEPVQYRPGLSVRGPLGLSVRFT